MNVKFTAFVLIFFSCMFRTFPDEVVSLGNGKKIIVFDDYTWKYFDEPVTERNYSDIEDDVIPPFLRQGIEADRDTIIKAVGMYDQGWRYTMPRPKSAKAAWGNHDGRTTWYYGWWYNEKTGLYSSTTPVIKENGLFIGDNQNRSGSWRNGGSPENPDPFMWLLSKDGGP